MKFVETPWIGRRALVGGLVAASLGPILPVPGAFGQEKARIRTPAATEGPFYPRDWRGDSDSDLVQVRGEAARALGKVLILQGKILRIDGSPVAGAGVEIWQCDAHGVYRHPADESPTRRRDRGFQGRGRILSDSAGNYRFRTIKPVVYTGRTPHIHFKVAPPKGRTLITQMYVIGEPENERDGVLNGIRDPRQRESVIIRLESADNLESGALGGIFDIVLA